MSTFMSVSCINYELVFLMNVFIGRALHIKCDYAKRTKLREGQTIPSFICKQKRTGQNGSLLSSLFFVYCKYEINVD